MVDLFTQLANGRTESTAVQPRLKTRFEDGAFELGERIPETLSADDTEAAPPLHRPRDHREWGDTTPAQGNAALSDRRTIRETPPLLDNQTTSRANHAPDTPTATVNIKSQEQTGIGAITPGVTQRRPIADSKIPDEGGDITPRSESQAQSASQPTSGEMPQVQPAVPRREFIPSGVGDAPNIEVHIGHLELRQAAQHHQQQTPAARPRFEPPLSLSDYLARRNGDRE